MQSTGKKDVYKLWLYGLQCNTSNDEKLCAQYFVLEYSWQTSNFKKRDQLMANKPARKFCVHVCTSILTIFLHITKQINVKLSLDSTENSIKIHWGGEVNLHQS
jgi:hypothetical protein